MGLSKLKNAFFYYLYGKNLQAKPFSENPKILLVSTTGLGDFIFSLPSLKALKKAFPNSEISYLTNQTGKELLQEEPDVSKVFTVTEPLFFSYFSLRKKLKKEHFDLIFLFHASQRLIFPLCASLKPKRFLGTKNHNKGLDFLFTDLASWNEPHEIDRRLEQVKLLVPDIEKTIPQITTTQKEKEKARKTLASLGISDTKPLLAIHAGAKDFYKCWPVENWLQFAQLVHQKGLFKILLLGGKNERSLNQILQKEAPFLTEAPQDLSLRELASLLTQVKVLVTNDTGPAHLAASLHIATVPIFSPTDPKKYAPYNPSFTQVIYEKRTCIPCLQRKCQLPFCLYQISPERVFEKVSSL